MAKIKKLLVANRGEIAIRIFRACKELDISTVAIYSEIDREALHVSFADEGHYVGETAPATSYLNIGKILEIAKFSGADAVHPGYGFLAENPRFAQAVEDAGLIWVGPPPKAVEAMGDKTAARRTAVSVGVAGVPGTEDPISDPSVISEFAAEHGWPVAIKAAHGGGGRGFRVVLKIEDAASAFEGAGREAQLAFGNPELYLERYLEEPRHVEIQIIGDQRGQVIHLGERDCSLQRRHQKLVEESPSPVVDEALREEIGAAAVKVAKAAGYYSAGTVEFLLERSGSGYKFWFLEVNTRLQVEHPVTELVAGVDLVKEMIRVAEGEKLSLSQDEVALRGHAIEARINAENPAKKFLPAPGLVTVYEEPAGPGVRVDSGVVSGSKVPQTYDSLIAKLIVHGRDRREAIARMIRALDEFRIEGLKTTIPFHRFALESDWFSDGEFSTRTIERLDLSHLADVTSKTRSLTPSVTPPRSKARRVVVEIGGKRFEANVFQDDEALSKPKVPDLRPRVAHAGSGEVITAPMQGTIVKTVAALGAKVSAGDPIVVLEAMKMENLIVCNRDGIVKELKVEAGQSVQAGTVLAVLGPPE